MTTKLNVRRRWNQTYLREQRDRIAAAGIAYADYKDSDEYLDAEDIDASNTRADAMLENMLDEVYRYRRMLADNEDWKRR